MLRSRMLNVRDYMSACCIRGGIATQGYGSAMSVRVVGAY